VRKIIEQASYNGVSWIFPLGYGGYRETLSSLGG